MARLPGSDIWFKTLRLRHDVRFTYYLSPNDSLVPDPQRKDKDFDSLVADPLNPRRQVLPHPDRDYVAQVVELPGAPPLPWLEARPDVPKGRTEEHHLASKNLGNEPSLWVYTPPGYAAHGKPYDLLVLLDGGIWAHMLRAPTIIDNLLAAGRIRPIVVVMVEEQDHLVELACSEPFNEFLVHELIPWVHEHYNVTTNPAETTIGGAWIAGLAAAFAGLRHSEIFGNVLSHSGSFAWDPREKQTIDKDELDYEWIIQQYAAGPKLRLRFSLTVGVFERSRKYPVPGFPIYPEMPSPLQANRHMRDVLLAKGYKVSYGEVADGEEFFAAAVALPDELMSLVGTRTEDKEAGRH